MVRAAPHCVTHACECVGRLTPAPMMVLTRLIKDDGTVAVTSDASIFSPSWNRTCVWCCWREVEEARVSGYQDLLAVVPSRAWKPTMTQAQQWHSREQTTSSSCEPPKSLRSPATEWYGRTSLCSSADINGALSSSSTPMTIFFPIVAGGHGRHNHHS